MVLVWEDGGYAWIEWKMDLELGEHDYLAFTNPDVVKYAESFGAKGCRASGAEALLPTCASRSTRRVCLSSPARWPTSRTFASPTPGTARRRALAFVPWLVGVPG